MWFLPNERSLKIQGRSLLLTFCVLPGNDNVCETAAYEAFRATKPSAAAEGALPISSPVRPNDTGLTSLPKAITITSHTRDGEMWGRKMDPMATTANGRHPLSAPLDTQLSH